MNASVVLHGATSALTASFCHSFDVSAGAEGSACTSKDNRSYISCYLGITEQRCLLETSGAAWVVERVLARGGEDRFDALRATLLDYKDRMHSNEPVHLWD